MRGFIRSIVFAVLVAAHGAAVAAPLELAPHKAIYDVRLVKAKQGSGIESVEGRMLTDWSEACDGWTMNHRWVFDIAYAPGPVVRISYSVSTWESRDGLIYNFDVRNATNGGPADKIAGRATLSGPGKAGRVVYTEPKAKTEILPANTVFPTTHSLRVLRAAADAPTIVAMTVFDGLSEDGALDINAVIGKPVTSKQRGTAAVAALHGRRSWPVHLAFYKPEAREAEPDQQMSMRMYDNGIGDQLVLEFGDFTVRANLVRVEIGTKPRCPG